MTEYALVGPGDVIDRYDTRVLPGVGTKEGWRWLPVERSILGSGEVRDPVIITVLKDKVTIVTPLRTKTVSEIDADKESVLDGFDRLTLALLFDHENRMRALEGKAAVTQAQFRAALKARL